MNFYISTEKSKMDVDLIHRFLSNDSYWAKGRSIEVVRKSINNSLCFGAFLENEQVGFARVVTDYAVFAWILDVFVLDRFRKNGVGKMLIDAITTYPELTRLQRWGLVTEDAHGLYEQYGFRIVNKPETFMERVSKPS